MFEETAMKGGDKMYWMLCTFCISFLVALGGVLFVAYGGTDVSMEKKQS